MEDVEFRKAFKGFSIKLSRGIIAQEKLLYILCGVSQECQIS